MHGVGRLLCLVILLASAGCQSIPSGSTGLTERISEILTAPAAKPAQEEGLAALIASRRGGRDDKQHEPAQSAPNSNRWSNNEVLRREVEAELAGATPQEREQFLQRLAGASDEEVAGMVNQRRRARRAAVSTASAGASLASLAQPVILTRPQTSSPSNDQEPSAPAHTPPELPPHVPRRSHPLLEDASQLAAPEPGGQHSVSRPAAPDPVPADEAQPPVVPVFDAFGAGGESLAAQQELAEASRIEMAGRDPIDAPQTQAEAIARNLDSDQAAQSVYWQEDLDKLITLLETQIAQQKPGSTDLSQDHYIRQHVALRMLYLIASRRPEALQAIPGVPQDRQEFWTRMFWALSSIFDEEAMPNSTVRAAETVAQLRAAIQQIEPRASLEVRGTVFCRQINGFGDFVPFAEEPFAPGQPVLVYTEVRNFQSLASGEGDYRTVLRSTITIQQDNVSGPVMFKYELPETEDRCQSRRSDYFHSYRIHLPETLKPGPHVLTLDVTDMLTGKNGSTTLNFVVR